MSNQNQAPAFTLEAIQHVGENDLYYFVVGRCGDRWLGFAAPKRSPAEKAFQDEGLPVGPQGLFVFSEVSDNYELGLLDRDQAIRLTGALAQDPENAYGGIDTWHVPDELRGKPEDFRCDHCDRVGCNGLDCAPDYGEDFPP